MSEDKLNEVMQLMSASRILVSILEQVGPISVSTERFMSANKNDRDLAVNYNEETLSFEFSLTEKTDG
jgi:hypothetical protein